MAAVIGLIKENMSPYAPPESEYDRIWQDYTGQTAMHGVVATIDGQVVGYGSVLIETKIRGGRVAHMEDICTDDQVRKQGIGSRIMSRLMEIAQQNGCYKASLTCQPHNTHFYFLSGFSEDGLSMGQAVIRP